MKHDKNTIALLIQILDEAFLRQTWHGPNLRGSIRGVTHTEAGWRPGAGRHNINEIVVHTAYWKYIVRRRLAGEKRGSFPLEGSNWFPRPDNPGPEEWREDVRLLAAMHKQLVEQVASMSPGGLHSRPGGSRYTNLRHIYGVAMHDIYHAGQIQILKRLMKSPEGQ
jgi:hypothetical protein